MNIKQALHRFLLVNVILFTLAVIPGHTQTDVVSDWNQEAVRLTLLPASNLAPAAQTRPMAIVHASIHDAVNGITGENRTYLPAAPAPAGASPEAAAIAAAHHALRNLFPSSASSLDAMFQSSLATHGLSTADPGVAYGQWAAAAVLAARSSDGSAFAQFSYTAPRAGQPGVWVLLTAQPALLPGWGDVTPWVLENNSHFLPPPPPDIASEQYARDYNEIKAVGSINSPTRTPEQTQIATFWLGSPTDIWNQPLRTLIASRNLSISARARIYALVYLAVADASIICWEAKYVYNSWRPQPAIRRGSEDGNGLTDLDPSWTPLFPTPRHPEYPSGHTMNSSAMATILSKVFGERPGTPITATVTGIERRWDTFGEGLNEVVDARIYSGIHFRTADETGSAVGTEIANYVWANALKPCRGGRRGCS